MATDLVGPIMLSLLECGEAALADSGYPVGLVHLAPGAQVAHDNCCEPGGQLWVRVIEQYPTGQPFPQRDSRPNKCGSLGWAVSLAMGVVRCAHTVDDRGMSPTAAEMTSDSLAVTRDAANLLEAIQCCFTGTPKVQSYVIDQWRPSGPQGGCVGGEWELTILVPDCACSVQ